MISSQHEDSLLLPLLLFADRSLLVLFAGTDLALVTPMGAVATSPPVDGGFVPRSEPLSNEVRSFKSFVSSPDGEVELASRRPLLTGWELLEGFPSVHLLLGLAIGKLRIVTAQTILQEIAAIFHICW